MYLTFFFSNFLINFFYSSLSLNKINNRLQLNKNNSFFNLPNSYKYFYKFSKQNNCNIIKNCIFYKIYKSNFFFSKTFYVYFLNKFALNANFINQINDFKNSKNSNLFFFFSNFNVSKLNSNFYHNFFLNKKFNNLNYYFFYKDFNNFFIKFSVTDFFKYVNNSTLNNLKIFFLRKNKIFNKGRYSRNRQYYRTGVYWCLYVNIVAVIGIYFWFYRFNMNFGYLWWILYFFIFTFFFSRSFSLGVFGFFKPFSQIFYSFLWFLSIINTLILTIYKFMKI